MYGFIYITTNTINNKKYIGMCSYKRKCWQTYLGSGKHLVRAVAKYGRENFAREVLAEAETKEQLIALELQYIRSHNAVNSDDYYNLVEGFVSKTFTGRKHTEDSNERRRLKLLGKPRPQYIRDILIKSNIGRPASSKQIQASINNGKKRAKEITIDNITYPSRAAAAKALGRSPAWIHKWYLS